MSLVFKTPKSTLNTTTGEGQNIGYGDCPECPECPKVELSDVDVEYTENGEYTLTPEGDGFSSVGITVNIDTQAIEDAAYAEGEAAGIITGKAQGVAEQKAKLETATFVSNGTYTKEDGYNEVTVDVPSDVNNQTKNVTISSNGTETITADSGYSGLGSVEVTVDVPEKQLTDTLRTYTENGEYTITPTEGYDGFSEVNVSVQIDEQAIYQDGFNSGLDAGIAEQKAKLTSTTFSSNDTFSNEDGWNEVTVDVQPNLDVLEVTPSTQSQQFLPESGYDGFSQVDVDPVTSAIDSNITASNIKKDVTILGVTGTYTPNTTTLEVAQNGRYNASEAGYDGYDIVTVNVPSSTVETGATYTADVIGTHTIEPSKGYDGMDSVELTVVTNPYGSTSFPFDDYLTMLKIDFDEGYYYTEITSGEINETTGYYDAESGGGEVLHIKPYISDGGDPATYSFPEDFDLVDKQIIVFFRKENATPITDERSGDVIGIDIDECELSSINDNANPETWLGGNCPDWSSIGWDCNDVTASGIDAELAYTAQKKAEYEAGTINNLASDSKLVFAPNINYPSNSSSFYANDDELTFVPPIEYTDIYQFYVESMFNYCVSLKYVDITLHNTIRIDNLFSNCTTLKTATLRNTSTVTSAKQAFRNCTYLEEAPFFDTSNVTNMSGMFQGCNQMLTTIPQYNTESVTDMSNFLNGCAKIVNIPLLNTSNVTTFSGAFRSTKITSIPQLNTSNVEDITNAFNSCKSLTTIPQLDFSKVKAFGFSFTNCTALTTIGGFINLGKALEARQQTFDLSASTLLTKESIMNVINNLAAPDNTNITGTTLLLSATSYALLTEEDIAIATAKNWSVTSV